jgi:hypothetical protein
LCEVELELPQAATRDSPAAQRTGRMKRRCVKVRMEVVFDFLMARVIAR